MVLSLGSNIDRDKNIRFALEKIAERFGETELSPVYAAMPVGFDGPSFFNLVLGLYASESLPHIRECLRGIEALAGRIRGSQPFTDRVLDIDVVLYGRHNLRPDGFNIPRDEIEKYAYVLKPLSELYPKLTHPISGLTFEKMWQDFDQSGQQLEVVNFAF